MGLFCHVPQRCNDTAAELELSLALTTRMVCSVA